MQRPKPNFPTVTPLGFPLAHSARTSIVALCRRSLEGPMRTTHDDDNTGGESGDK